MGKKETEKQIDVASGLSDFFDLLAMFDYQDMQKEKLASEVGSSKEDSTPESNSGTNQTNPSYKGI
jgi:hypothetical protein